MCDKFVVFVFSQLYILGGLLIDNNNMENPVTGVSDVIKGGRLHLILTSKSCVFITAIFTG